MMETFTDSQCDQCGLYSAKTVTVGNKFDNCTICECCLTEALDTIS